MCWPAIKWTHINDVTEQNPHHLLMQILWKFETACSELFRSYFRLDFCPEDGTALERTTLQWRHNRHMASQITSLMIVYSAVYSGADQRKYQSSAYLDFVREIHRWPQRTSNAKNVSIWWRHNAVQYRISFLDASKITQLSWKLICPYPISQISNYFAILYRTRQYKCHAKCKIATRLDNWNGC